MGGLTIKTRTETQPSHPRVTIDRNLWLTATGKLVEDGDPEAKTLYASAGKQVLRKDFEALGGVVEKPDAEPKQAPAADNKEASEREDKDASGDADDKDEDEAPDYEAMSYRELQAACKKLELPASGTTDDLIERLKES